MAVSDPIADLLTRIRNAVTAQHARCEIPASKTKEAVLSILKKSGFIRDFVRQEDDKQDKLIVVLKYLGRAQKPVIQKMRRVSKPGRRCYSGYAELKPVLGGLGLSIISTPKGIMTDREAREQKLGGEILCEVW